MLKQTIIILGKIAIAIFISIVAMRITVAFAGIYDPQPIIGPDFGLGWGFLVGYVMICVAVVSFITCMLSLEYRLRTMLRWWLFALLATNFLAAIFTWITALCNQDYVYSL